MSGSPEGPPIPGTGEAGGRRQRGRVLPLLLRAFVSTESYGLVLALIVVTYLLSVSVRRGWMASVVLLVQIVTVWFALRTSRARRSTRLVADVLLVAAGSIALVTILTGAEKSPVGLVFLTSSVLYLIAPVSILRHLVSRPVVDLETMLGAVAAYLLIAMFFAFTYRSLGAIQADPFFGRNGEGTMAQDLFFSFTTVTTTGYGNLVPAKNPGQSLAVAEMIIGQLFLITALGKIVNSWRPKRLRDADDGVGAGSG